MLNTQNRHRALLLSRETEQFVSVLKTKSTYTDYSVSSRGHDGLIWTVSRIVGERETPIFEFEADPLKGLAIRTLKASESKGSTRLNVEAVLQAVATESLKAVPSQDDPTLKGSVFLAIVFRSLESVNVDLTSIGINSCAKLDNLTSEDWVKAYQFVANTKGINFPGLATDFIERCEGLGVDTNNSHFDELRFGVALAGTDQDEDETGQDEESVDIRLAELELDDLARLSESDIMKYSKNQVSEFLKANNTSCKGTKEQLVSRAMNVIAEIVSLDLTVA